MSAPIDCRLSNYHVWTSFPSLIENRLDPKKGRAMNPTPSYCIYNLDPVKYYAMFLRFDPVADVKLMFTKSQWYHSDEKIVPEASEVLIPHPDDVQLGSHWLNRIVEFRPRLTDNRDAASDDVIFLQTLVHYRPVLIVAEISVDEHGERDLVGSANEFWYEDASFVTVRYYKAPGMGRAKNVVNSEQIRRRNVDHSLDSAANSVSTTTSSSSTVTPSVTPSGCEEEEKFFDI